MPASDPSTNPHRLLLIEDDTLEILIFERTLKCVNPYTVLTVSHSVRDALYLLSIASYDVIVLDLYLPDGDGADVLRVMRSQGIETPVFVRSASASPKDIARVQKYGVETYSVKDHNQAEMKRFLESVVEVGHMQEAE